MDTFAHGFWSLAVYHKKSYVWLAVLFGILPDLLSFGTLFLINAMNGNFRRGPPPMSSIPDWLHIAYNLTHSLVLFAIVFVVIYIITKSWFWPLTAWAVHILIDMPTHSQRFFPTPFLWPLSGFAFDGVSWATPWFMILNYVCLIVIFILIAVFKL